MSYFPFAQFELAGSYGIDDGRYPIRSQGSGGSDPEATDAVLVAETLGAVAPSRRRRRAKPRAADPDREPTVPVTRLTVIEAAPLEDDPSRWLDELRRDEERRAELANRSLAHARRAIAARRVAAADAALVDPTLESALAVRLGYGEGDALVGGRYEAAIELPAEGRRRDRAAALRPQERMAALLGGRERPLACEELIMRARIDLDAGRTREAALQARVALEALLAERERLTARGRVQEADLDFLDERREMTGAAANEALRGELMPDRAAEVDETIEVCRRVLRRRAAMG